MSKPVISVAPVTVGEDDGYATFVVQLNAPSASTVTVNYGTSDGTAVADTDFIAVSGSLTFAPGETVQTVQVPIVAGSTVPPKGDFFLDLSSASNAVLGNTEAMATIIANTAPSGTPVMSISDPVVDAAAGSVSFVVTLNQPSTGTVTVNYATAAGSDTANNFVPISGALAFAPGDTAKTVTVLLTDPTTATPEEDFNLVLSGVVGATLPNPVGTARVGAADQPTVTTPVISVAPVTVGEDDGYATFVVQLNAPSVSTVTVNYGTSDGTAVADTDFIAVSGSLTFAPGETVQTVQVPIVAGSTLQSSGSFFLNLDNPANATIASGSANVTAMILPVVTGGPRTLVWTGAFDNNLANPANWDDTTDAANPATSAPNTMDTAEFGAGNASVTGSASVAVLTISGSDSVLLTSGAVLVSSGAVTIGNGTAAALTIEGGAGLVGGSALIGSTSGASGSSVTVTGTGSYLQIAGALEVGNTVTGSLDITTGGSVVAASIDIGVLANSSGTVTVAGANADLTTTGEVTIGESGAGNLFILSGANVTIGGNLNIGQMDGGSGNAEIEDPGSTVNILGSLDVGAIGTAVLSVGAGSALDVSGALTVNGTLTNAGAIIGGGATEVTFSSGTDRLILSPGATFGGTVVGGGGNTTLELAQGTTAGTLSAFGTTFTGFGSVVIDAGATWTVDALASALPGTNLTGNGGSSTLMLTTAGSVNLGGVSNFATIDLAAGTNTVTVTDTTLSGGVVTINGATSGNNTINAASDTAASKGKSLTYNAGSGTDTFTGGFENDTVSISAAALAGDTFTGGTVPHTPPTRGQHCGSARPTRSYDVIDRSGPSRTRRRQSRRPHNTHSIRGPRFSSIRLQ